MTIYNYAITVPNGTITTSTTSYTVTGTATEFGSISVGSVLLNSANLAIGRVIHVNSNVSLMLAANANIAVSNSVFYVNSFAISPPSFTFNYELGTIYVNENSNIVYGNGTFFSNTISTGQSILIPDDNATNILGKRVGTSIGIVDFVDTNTRLHLRDNSFLTANATTWTFGDPKHISPTPDTSVKPLSKYADGFHNMLRPIFHAVDQGIFTNVEQVHSYHPPVQDPVTGIMVNIPATTFRKMDVEVPVTGNSLGYGNTISNLNLGESNQVGTVMPFRMNNERFGMHPAYVKESVPTIDIISSVVEQFQTEKPEGVDYKEIIKQTYPETMADRIADQLGIKINRITDDLNQADSYLKTQPVQMTDVERQNLAHSTSSKGTYVPLSQKTLKASGVPISIPGLINAVATDQAPNSLPSTFSAKHYYTPQFGFWNKL